MLKQASHCEAQKPRPNSLLLMANEHAPTGGDVIARRD